MTGRQLPPPVTTDQAYMAALLDEIKGLRADLRDGTQPSHPTTDIGGEVLLTEPEPAAPRRAVDVDEFHTGGGWYELPDGSKVRGRDNAEQALREG